MADTIFSRIIAGTIPARIEHEDDLCLAFHDVSPQAPVHILVIPKRAIPSVAHLEASDASIVGHLVLVAAQVASRSAGATSRLKRLLTSQLQTQLAGALELEREAAMACFADPDTAQRIADFGNGRA